MKIYEYIKCDRCGDFYKGVFQLNIDGTVSCIDCDKKEYISEDLTITKTRDKELLHKQLLDMMIYDISEIYTYYSTMEESAIDKFMTSENNLDMEKVFFMGNNLCVIDKAQEMAYIGIKYTNLYPKGDLIEDANYFINKYINLREYKFKKEEFDDYVDALNNRELVYRMKQEVE